MIDNLYSALKRRRCGRAVTSESGSCRAVDGGAPAALPASPLRSEAANAAEEVLVLLVLIKVRFLSPPYSNCPGSTCLTHVGTEGIDKYEPQVGPCKGWSLNAAASDDYDNPVYDYISGTPYGAAYGASAVDHAVRVWRVSGAPYGVSAGDWVVRQPLQAVIQLSSQAGQALPSNQSVNHSSLGVSEDEIEFLDVTPNQTGQTTPFSLEGEDELG